MTDGEVANRLWGVRDGVADAKVPGMMERCMAQTITVAIGKPAWRADWKITDGAVELLMVEERGMLAAGDISNDVRMGE